MKSILIIDDEDQLRETLRMILEEAGYVVFDAPNGKVGLQTYKQHPVDIVLTDIFMPKIDGLDTIMELCRHCTEAKIIAMSGGSVVAEKYSSLSITKILGAVATIAKPFHEHELLDLIQKTLGEKE